MYFSSHCSFGISGGMKVVHFLAGTGSIGVFFSPSIPLLYTQLALHFWTEAYIEIIKLVLLQLHVVKIPSFVLKDYGNALFFPYLLEFHRFATCVLARVYLSFSLPFKE
jgi:hypothetical protein